MADYQKVRETVSYKGLDKALAGKPLTKEERQGLEAAKALGDLAREKKAEFLNRQQEG